MRISKTKFLKRLSFAVTIAFILLSLSILFHYKTVMAQEDAILDKKDKDIDFTELYNIIEDEKKKLDEKKKELEEQEKQLKELQSDISREYKKLSDIKKELEKEFSKKEETKGVEIKGIVKLYEAMSAEEAARAIEKMDKKLAAQLISQMNPRKSGKILDAMDTLKVKEITKEMYDKQAVE